MDYMWIVWLIVTILFLIVEVTTVALVSIWFIIGAVIAMIASLFGASLLLQIILFLLISIVLLVCFYAFGPKLGFTEKNRNRTNADRLIGDEALVIQAIDPITNHGQVKIKGQIWSASAVHSGKIEEGKKVIVKDIEGVRLVVKEERDS